MLHFYKPNQSNRHVVHLLGNSQNSALAKQLRCWDTDVKYHNDTVSLLAAAWNTPVKKHPFTTLLCDMRKRTENPHEIAHILRCSSKLQTMRCILLTPEENPSLVNAYLQSGYNEAFGIAHGIDYTLLFNALYKKETDKYSASPTVTSLVDHYLHKKSQLPPLEILLADSSPVHTALTQGVLKKAGHNVYPVHQGEQTLDILYMHQFDCIIINHKMSGIDGTEVCRIHRLNDIGPLRTPIIMTTSEITEEIYQRCQESGANAVLPLPINTAQLFATLKAFHLGHQRNIKLPSSYHSFAESLPTRFDKQFNSGVLDELGGLEHNIDFTEKIIGSFINESISLLNASKKATEQHDWLSFRNTMHDLKGAAGSIGLGNIYHLCLQITSIPPRSLPDTAQKQLAELSQQLDKSYAQLRQYINKHKTQNQEKNH